LKIEDLRKSLRSIIKKFKNGMDAISPGGLLFFTFWPSCPPVFLEDQQKVKR